MKPKIACFLIFSVCFLATAQQELFLKVTTVKGAALDDVSVYANNALMGKTDDNGTLELKSIDATSLVLIKAGFEEKTVTLEGKPLEVVLYGFGIKNLDAIEIVKPTVTTVFSKLLANTQKGNFYIYKSDNAIYNRLSCGTDTLHYLNNKVYWIPNKGLHIENKQNVIRNFVTRSDKNTIISNIYNIAGVNIDLSLRYTNKVLSMSHIKPFVDLNKDLRSYAVYFSKKGDTIRADFEPKTPSTDLMYTGHITYNLNDYGIYEMEFNSTGAKNYGTSYNYFNSSQTAITCYDEYLFIANTRKDDGRYYAKGSEYSIKTEALGSSAQGHVLELEFKASPIELIKPTTKIKFDIFTYRFDE